MMSLRARQLPAAIVPGSHKPEKVRAINEMRAQCWEGQGRDRKWVGPGREGEFLEAFTANGLQVSVMATPVSPSSTATKREFPAGGLAHSRLLPQPVVLKNRAGDLVLFGIIPIP